MLRQNTTVHRSTPGIMRTKRPIVLQPTAADSTNVMPSQVFRWLAAPMSRLSTIPLQTVHIACTRKPWRYRRLRSRSFGRPPRRLLPNFGAWRPHRTICRAGAGALPARPTATPCRHPSARPLARRASIERAERSGQLGMGDAEALGVHVDEALRQRRDQIGLPTRSSAIMKFGTATATRRDRPRSLERVVDDAARIAARSETSRCAAAQ